MSLLQELLEEVAEELEGFKVGVFPSEFSFETVL